MFRAKINEAGLDKHVRIDSAGTHGIHIGETPDVRMIRSAKKRGYDLADVRARQISKEDLLHIAKASSGRHRNRLICAN